ncbi:MAG: J domain-containing protein, partial [Deltaproteobacteria bacterium]|nr:J domain-containing protein [Deltaproteobacteria bacterium]
MDIETAYEILGLSKSASLQEVKTRYRQLVRKVHPDVPQTGDRQQFLLITTAYTLITDHLLARKPSQDLTIPDDVIDASAITQRTNERFDDLQRDYLSFRERMVNSTKDHIVQLINLAASGTDLKNKVKKEIEITWAEMGRKLEDYVGRLIRNAATEDKDFLYALFSDMYDVRKRHWFLTLYQNPVIITGMFSFMGITVAQYYPEIDVNFPLIAAIANTPWAQFFPLQCIAAYMIFKLWV